MDFNTQLQHLKKLNLPPDQFMVVSSGALSVRGIRESKDIDVIVTDSLWSELTKKYKVELNEWDVERINLDNDIEILNPTQSIFGNKGGIQLEEIFEKADVFDGIKFINLKHLRKIKMKLGREKDLQDVILIDNFMKNKNGSGG